MLTKLKFKIWRWWVTPRYKLIEELSQDKILCPVLVKSGQFKGVCFYIGHVSFTKSGVKFMTDVIANPRGVDTETPFFTRAAGLILDDLLLKSYKSKAPVLIPKE